MLATPRLAGFAGRLRLAGGRRWESTKRQIEVVYPGRPGSLSHLGATQFFRGSSAYGIDAFKTPGANLKGVGDFPKTFEAVINGDADYGVVPMENSSSGTIVAIYELLMQHDVAVDGDLGVHETYCLCVEPGVELSQIKSVTSHPVILDACSQFISQKLPADQNLIATKSTCEAAIATSKDKGTGRAAIATQKAASLNGLTVIASDIGNDVTMETRYILIRKAGSEGPGWSIPQTHNLDAVRKRSACFGIPNDPGAAFKLMSVFALRNVNICKLETRPLSARLPSGCTTKGSKLWDQVFYLDYLEPRGFTEDDREKLWSAACEFSTWQRDFGTYNSFVTRTEKKPQTWDDIISPW